MNVSELIAQDAFHAYLDMHSLIKGGRVAANWLPDGRFWFVQGAPTETTIHVFDPKARKISPLFDLAKTRIAFQKHFGREAPYAGLPFESFRLSPEGGVVFTLDAIDYRLDTERYTIATLPKPNAMDEYAGISAKARFSPRMFQRPGYFVDESPVPETLSPDTRRFAAVRDGEICFRSTVDGRYERVTFDAEPDYGWDVESVRMGAGAGFTYTDYSVNPWSSDSLKLYATRVDKRRVGKITRTRYLQHVDEVETGRVTRAGDGLPIIEPYVIDVLSKRQTRITLQTQDRFLRLLGWVPDSDQLYLFSVSRDMREADVIVANSVTGQTQTLFSEVGQTFIRIQHDVIYGSTGCTVLPNGAGFLWESERSGWKHLYHYDLQGHQIRQLTDGAWPVVSVLAVDAASGWVYFSSHHDQSRPYDVHVCRVPFNGGAVERLTEQQGIHDIQFAPDRSYFVDTVQRPDVPPRSEIRSAAGERWHEFTSADISNLEALGWAAPEEICVKAADGETSLWAVICKPRDFNPTTSYPVIEYIYGGPQISVVNHGFVPAIPLTQALPQLGYVVVISDARGTPERSKAFQDVTYGEWRRHVTADHAAVLRNLAKTRPWMDLQRVGIWGHSWGGYFTFASLIDNPDLYRAGIAAAPGFDPYALFLYEPYLGGVPTHANKAAYEDALLYTDAAKLQGDLMIVAGSNDTSVWNDAVKMTNALIEAGKPHEFVMLPGQHHGFGAVYETYFVGKLVDFFDRTVKRT